MRVPIGWLAEYVDVPAGTSVEDLDTAFVRLGLEVEEIHRPEEVTGPLVVGKVLEIEELTGFKKPIRYCAGRRRRGGARGASSAARSNFAVGDTVVVALPGAVLPGGFEIAARTTYDHVSDGMICSVRELGIGDDHAGILVLGARRRRRPAAGHARRPGRRSGRRRHRAGRHARPRLLPVHARHRPRDGHRPGRAVARPGRGHPAGLVRRARLAGHRRRPRALRPVLDDRDGGPRPDRAEPVVDAPPARAGRASAASRWPSTSPTT